MPSLLVLSILLNLFLIYRHFKKPHRHIKVYQHPEIPQVWVHKLKTRKARKESN